MPRRIFKKRVARKGGRKPRRSQNGPKHDTMNPHSDHATCTEVIENDGLPTNTLTSIQFSINSGGGTQFQRALVLASQYKLYRATKVEYEYLPTYNTFQEGTGNSVPYLWIAMNRSGENPPPTASVDRQYLERMGAMPIKLTKPCKKIYKPNTLMGTMSSHTIIPKEGNTGQILGNWSFTPKYDEWFSTEILKQAYDGARYVPLSSVNEMSASPPLYYGHYFYIQQDESVTEARVCDLVVKVHWEFKEPRSLVDAQYSTIVPVVTLFPSTQT